MKIIFQNDNVTLQGVSETHVWFCVTKNVPDKNVYTTTTFPFAFMAQFFMANELIIISHETLHKLADEMNWSQNDNELILINNTGRCGSTLLCQMFGKLPNTNVMSEPWGLLYPHRLLNR